MNEFFDERSAIERLFSSGRYRPDPTMRAILLEKADVLLLNPYVSASIRAELFPPERIAIDATSMVLRGEGLPSGEARGMLVLAFLLMDAMALLRLDGISPDKKSVVFLSIKGKCKGLSARVKEKAGVLGTILLQDAVGGNLLAKRVMS